MMDVWVVGANSHSVLQFFFMKTPFFTKLLHTALENVFSDLQNLSPPGFIEKLHSPPSQQSSWSHVF